MPSSASACSPSSSASWACSTPSSSCPPPTGSSSIGCPAWRPATSGSCATPWTATTPAPSFFGTFGLLLLAFILLGLFPPKTLFFPENEPAYINAFIEAPIGTDILKTDSITRLIEKQVMEVIDVPEYKVPPGTKMPDGTVTQDSVNFLVNSVIAKWARAPATPRKAEPVGATPNKGRVASSAS
jgi:hypothetical protein